MIAGSSAFDLGDQAQAIRSFDAAIQADYRGDDQYPRSHAIYLARAAEAHLALHDLDATIDRANHAVRCLGALTPPAPRQPSRTCALGSHRMLRHSPYTTSSLRPCASGYP